MYKLVWMDLLTYTVIYYICSAVYRVALTEPGKRMFEKVSQYCNSFSDLIPVSFVLGFYVSIVIKRWWSQYMSLPWPDSLSLFISTSIHGHDRQGRLMRRTIVRYVNLSFVLTLTMITPRAKKRFPSLDHLVEAGFMTANEKKIFESLAEKTVYSLYYLPLVWAGTLVARARREGRIRDDFAVKTIIDELNNLRGKCGGLLSYDWISIPLVYTQVVSLAVYMFFLSTIMGRQFLDPAQNYPKNNIDFYFPVFTILQFFFYMGWLKVAESLVNPFGEDDDDFEVNWLIDRNIQVSYLIVDEMHNEHPELTQDLYWDEVFPQELPYTVASEQFRREPPMGSTANIQVPESEQEFLPIVDEEPEDDDDEKTSSGLIFKRRGSARSVVSSAPSARKSSFMSIMQNRLLPSTTGSPSSVRKSQHKGLNRSVSRTSGGSPSTNFKRQNTSVSMQDSNIFHMSEESLVTVGGKEERGGPKQPRRPSAAQAQPTLQEDEDTLLIKINRSDKDGQEARGSQSEIRWESTRDAERTGRTPSSLTSQASRRSQWNNSDDDLMEVRSSGSRCSISTSIFHAADSGATDYDNIDKPATRDSQELSSDTLRNEDSITKDDHDNTTQPIIHDITLRGSSDDDKDDIGSPTEERSSHRVSWGVDKTHK